MCVCACVGLFSTPWTVTCQAPLSMGFPRQEYRSGLPFPSRREESIVPACVLSHFSRVRLFVTPWTVAHQAPVSMGFPRQEYRSGLPCPPLGDLLNPGIESISPVAPALAGGFFTTEPPGNLLRKMKVKESEIPQFSSVQFSRSVMSNSVRPHRRQPTRLPVPGILQARTLEWVAISFSNA